MPNIKSSPYILKADKLETQENKTLIVDKNSTDEQYPSAKAVYDALSGFTLPPATFDVDQTYNPESENPQSGIAVAEAIGGLGNTWEKIADITTTEEVNGITATVEEFPDITKCKEFIIRIIFPVSPTGENLSLGGSYIYFDNSNTSVFRFAGTTLTSVITEQRCHTFIADGLIYSTGTNQTISVPSVTGQMSVIVGDRVKRKPINSIIYLVYDTTKKLPIGTRLEIYGKKVEIGESAEALLNEKIGDIETLLGGI